MIVGEKFYQVVESNPGLTDLVGTTANMAIGTVKDVGSGVKGLG